MRPCGVEFQPRCHDSAPTTAIEHSNNTNLLIPMCGCTPASRGLLPSFFLSSIASHFPFPNEEKEEVWSPGGPVGLLVDGGICQDAPPTNIAPCHLILFSKTCITALPMQRRPQCVADRYRFISASRFFSLLPPQPCFLMRPSEGIVRRHHRLL